MPRTFLFFGGRERERDVMKSQVNVWIEKFAQSLSSKLFVCIIFVRSLSRIFCLCYDVRWGEIAGIIKITRILLTRTKQSYTFANWSRRNKCEINCFKQCKMSLMGSFSKNFFLIDWHWATNLFLKISFCIKILSNTKLIIFESFFWTRPDWIKEIF